MLNSKINFSAYKLISDVIETKRLSKEDLLNKLDVLFFANRVSKDEYEDLHARIENVYT